MLLINTIVLAVALCAIAFSFALYIEAELKLAKHGESTIFKEKK